MIESNKTTCSACGCTSAPDGSRFCPDCGTNLSVESEEIHTMDTPTATALPISAVGPSSTVTPSSLDRSVGADESPSKVNGALYFKNPSSVIMGRSKKFDVNLGVLFIGTANPKGKFTVPKCLAVVSILSGSRIDLSVADFVHPVSKIRVLPSVISGLLITVPRGVRVETRGIGVIGVVRGLNTQNVHVGEEAPLLVVQGLTMLGWIEVNVNKNVPPVTIVE